MGRNPDEIEREIARRRAEMTARIQGVQARVRDDVTSLKQTAEEQTSEAVNQTKAKLDFSGQARERPYTMLAGALGLGVVLGAASEGIPGVSGSPQNGSRSASQSSSDNGSSGMLGGLVTSMLGPTADTVRDELRELVREGFSSFKQSSGINQDPRQAPAQTPPHT